MALVGLVFVVGCEIGPAVETGSLIRDQGHETRILSVGECSRVQRSADSLVANLRRNLGEDPSTEPIEASVHAGLYPIAAVTPEPFVTASGSCYLFMRDFPEFGQEAHALVIQDLDSLRVRVASGAAQVLSP